MVLPPELEKRNHNAKTLEQQLTEKFFYLQTAREERYNAGSDVVFDEVSKSIETLLRAIPEAFNSLVSKRSELDSAFEEERSQIYAKASQAPDDITKDFIWNQQLDAAKWEYRELYEELIIDVLQEFQLIHMMRPPQVAVIPSQQQEPQQQEPIQQSIQQSAPEQPSQQPPEPQGKRRLSFALSKREHNEPPTI
jgi:hypothetical protein